jgi:hypothetical protein
MNAKVLQRRLQRGVRQRSSKRGEALHAASKAILDVKAHSETVAHLQRRKRRLRAQQPRRVFPIANHVLGRQDL